MAYTINLTNGTTLTTVEDGTVNTTSCSLTLIGKNYAGYGTIYNDNIVHLLENSSNDTQPNYPLTGQLWWDTAGNLKVYTGAEFKTLAASISSATEPNNPVTGNFWWDTVNQQLKTYNGSNWILVGPNTGANVGNSGVYFGNIVDNVSQSHIAANIIVNSNIMAIISSDSTSYTPDIPIPGFSNIKPGFNLVSSGYISDSAYWGVAENATKLGNIDASNYARTNNESVTKFNDGLASNISLSVGTNSNLVANLSGYNANITNTINSGNLSLRVNFLGNIVNSININGQTGNIQLAGNLTSSSNITTTKTITASSAILSSSLSAASVTVTSNLSVANNFNLSNTANMSGNLMLNGYEVLSDNAAVNLQVVSSYFSTTGAWDATLAAGTQGQIKVLMMLADSGNMVITVTNPAWGGSGTLTFDNVGQACTLQYMANKWFVIGNNGVTIA